MAQIVFTIQEVFQCIESNGWLLGKIDRIALEEIGGNIIAVRLVNTGIPGLHRVKIPIEFVEYIDGICLVRIKAAFAKAALIGTALKLIDHKAIEIDKLNIRIDVNELLSDKVKGVAIEDMSLNDGQVIIKLAASN